MDKIIIIDFGGQYAHLIANRIRRLGVYSEIRHNDVDIKELKSAKGIILSGGPQNISEDDSLKIDKRVFDLEIPVLGICYGHQLMSHLLGGEVSRGKTKEYGNEIVEVVQRYQKDHGTYPEEINKLVPDYLPSAPTYNCMRVLGLHVEAFTAEYEMKLCQRKPSLATPSTDGSRDIWYDFEKGEWSSMSFFDSGCY